MPGAVFLPFADYRRQFPASPIVADSAVAGDDGVPAVSLPHDREERMDTNHPGPERQSTPNVEPADRDTITCLTEPMLLVDGVMGLPLKGHAPSDRGAALLSNPLAHNREGRLLTAKRKLLVRRRCCRWLSSGSFVSRRDFLKRHICLN